MQNSITLKMKQNERKQKIIYGEWNDVKKVVPQAMIESLNDCLTRRNVSFHSHYCMHIPQHVHVVELYNYCFTHLVVSNIRIHGNPNGFRQVIVHCIEKISHPSSRKMLAQTMQR